jgi:ATP-dependent Clp protease protease subunit
VRHTGKDYATIERTLDRDYFMSAEEAREFGIVDQVMTDRAALEAAEKPAQLIAR